MSILLSPLKTIVKKHSMSINELWLILDGFCDQKVSLSKLYYLCSGTAGIREGSDLERKINAVFKINNFAQQHNAYMRSKAEALKETVRKRVDLVS